MDNSGQEISEKMKFSELYSSFSDEKILEILRYHKDYQVAAVDAAVEIAVGRQLINSAQDLLAPEFQNRKTIGFSLFPEITDSYHSEKLIGSIFRFLFVISFLPVIYAFLNYGKGNLDQTFLGSGTGLVWFLLCLFLRKTRKPFIFILLFTILVLVSSAVCLKMVSYGSIKILDFVILVIGSLLPLYLLVLLKKLIQQKLQ